MKTFYLLCGMPFSGKTTLGKYLAPKLEAFYISLDEINKSRGLFGGEGISIEEWEKTHHLAMQDIQNFMPSHQDIILDDTNCFRWLRDRFRNWVAQYEYNTVLIFIDLSAAEIERRIVANNKIQSRHKVKPEIIEEMKQTFEPPQADEETIVYHPSQSIEDWITQNFTLK